MEQIQRIIASNLKQLRDKHNLSLDALSKLSGVSKSMLGQIERGEVNPTVTIVDKIASGFHLSFAELTAIPQPLFEIADPKELSPVYAAKKSVRTYPTHTHSGGKRTETAYLEIDPKTTISLPPAPLNSTKLLFIGKGTLLVHLEGEPPIKLGAGMSMKLSADCSHALENAGNKTCRLFSTLIVG